MPGHQKIKKIEYNHLIVNSNSLNSIILQKTEKEQNLTSKGLFAFSVGVWNFDFVQWTPAEEFNYSGSFGFVQALAELAPTPFP